MSKSDILEQMQNDVMKSDLCETEKNKFLRNLLHLKERQLNIMITGGTGVGKSSTINALFNIDGGAYKERAKVGIGNDPETKDIEKYELGNLVLWDTPGFGDGRADKLYAERLIKQLHELDNAGSPLIDLVLVIVDGSNRDMGSSFKLINDVIVPNLGQDKENRMVVAINQADQAMKGRNWDWDKSEPNQKLVCFLEDKARSVKERIWESTRVDCEPIYYSAGYKEVGEPQQRPYNLSKLLYYIVKSIPAQKRLLCVDHINKDKEHWQSDDGRKNYRQETKKSFWESIEECMHSVLDPIVDTVDKVMSWFFG